MWAGLESRKFPRVKASCKIFLQHGSDVQPVKASTENLGAGGLCIFLDRPLDKMSNVKIELDLQDGKNPIQCSGRVVWTVRKRSFKAGEEGHDIGIEFVNLPETDLSRISALVSRTGTAKK